MYIFSAFAYFAKDGIRSKQCIRPRILADSCRADHLCTVQHIAFHGARSAQLARRRCCCCCCCREFNAWFIQFDAWCMSHQFSSVQLSRFCFTAGRRSSTAAAADKFVVSARAHALCMGYAAVGGWTVSGTARPVRQPRLYPAFIHLYIFNFIHQT